MGTALSQGLVQYPAGTSNPTLVLTNTDGVSRLPTMTVGAAAHPRAAAAIAGPDHQRHRHEHAECVGRHADHRQFQSRKRAATYVTSVAGTMLMGGGTLDATTIVIGTDTPGSGATKVTYAASGTLTLGSNVGNGTVIANMLYLGLQNSSAAACGVAGTFNLNGGILSAGTSITGGPAPDRAGGGARHVELEQRHHRQLLPGLRTGRRRSRKRPHDRQRCDHDPGRHRHACLLDRRRADRHSHAAIGGSGALTMTGSGLLALTANNGYSGGTIITSGTLADAKQRGLGHPTFRSTAGLWTFTACLPRPAP